MFLLLDLETWSVTEQKIADFPFALLSTGKDEFESVTARLHLNDNEMGRISQAAQSHSGY